MTLIKKNLRYLEITAFFLNSKYLILFETGTWLAASIRLEIGKIDKIKLWYNLQYFLLSLIEHLLDKKLIFWFWKRRKYWKKIRKYWMVKFVFNWNLIWLNWKKKFGQFGHERKEAIKIKNFFENQIFELILEYVKSK